MDFLCGIILLIWDNGFAEKYKSIYKVCVLLITLSVGMWSIIYQTDNTGKTYITVTEGSYYDIKSICTKYKYSKDTCIPIEKMVKYKALDNPVWEKFN